MANIERKGVPAWLENRRIDDELLSRAYEDTSNARRVALKTAIAATHFYFGSPLKGSGASAQGNLFSWRSHARPVAWSAIFAPADFDAAALVMAAALLPLLAGVDHRLWFMCGSEPHPSQLVALELCGQEENFLLGQQDVPKLLEELPPSCRCLFLHEPYPTSLPCRVLNACPRALLAEKSGFREDLLRFALGPTPLARESAGENRWDVIYASASSSFRKDLSAHLRLGPGLECFWLFPQLTPDFFRETSIAMDMEFLMARAK